MKHTDDTPTRERASHGNVVFERTSPRGMPRAGRYRIRPVLTDMDTREEIIQDVAARYSDERSASRALNHRLSPLDRALNDNEARALNRIISAINYPGLGGGTRSTDYVEAGNMSRLPMSEYWFREVGLAQLTLRAIPQAAFLHVQSLAAMCSPLNDVAWKLSKDQIKTYVNLAILVSEVYENLTGSKG